MGSSSYDCFLQSTLIESRTVYSRMRKVLCLDSTFLSTKLDLKRATFHFKRQTLVLKTIRFKVSRENNYRTKWAKCGKHNYRDVWATHLYNSDIMIKQPKVWGLWWVWLYTVGRKPFPEVSRKWTMNRFLRTVSDSLNQVNKKTVSHRVQVCFIQTAWQMCVQ